MHRIYSNMNCVAVGWGAGGGGATPRLHWELEEAGHVCELRFNLKVQPSKNALSSAGPVRVGRNGWAVQNLMPLEHVCQGTVERATAHNFHALSFSSLTLPLEPFSGASALFMEAIRILQGMLVKPFTISHLGRVRKFLATLKILSGCLCFDNIISADWSGS